MRTWTIWLVTIIAALPFGCVRLWQWSIVDVAV